jgi:pyruvate/2-oxoglutarate dehydrogenase complex dihydrolipoamide dehydrogenase (E3) component
MLHSAHAAHHARHGAPGVATSLEGLDFAAIMDNKDRKVARFQAAKIAGVQAGDFDLIDARARFAGPDTVEAGGETYRFTQGAVVATGSVPTLPPIAGIEDVGALTSDDALRLREPPASLIVLGVGAIGLELGQFFARVGTRVDLFARRRVFEDVDPAVSAEMEAALRAEPNLTLHQERCPTRVRRTAEGVAVDLAHGTTVEAEAILAATGRRWNVEGLGLDAAGVEVAGEALHAGPDMRTSNPRVFVAGDASGERQLLHVANWEGAVAGHNAATGDDRRVEQRLHMEVVFTDPPMARIGLSEREARAQGLEVVTAEARFPSTGRAITMDVEHGVWKLVADARTGELLGSQILGPRADDVVHVVSTAMHFRGTARDLLAMPWYHPTLTEVLLSLARDIDARVAG